ncbi:hypothetical protein V7157_11300 [Neobacillus drentensis]|uniref:hypothetical protein n=1 Tax=Neobacillus drentensis TaxID=220684 RepID=UPI002FFDCBEB
MRKLLQRVALSATLPILLMLAWVLTPVSAEGTVVPTSITEDTNLLREYVIKS